MTSDVDEVCAQADEAARAWVANPKMPKPANPHDAGTPEAARWKAHFERCLLQYSAVGDADERSA